MKQTLILIGACVFALLFNIDWEWHSSTTQTISFIGPPSGIALCAVLCGVFLYRGFLSFQDYLVARRLLTERVKTSFDLLPILLIIPLAIGYIWRGDTWYFKWGTHEAKMWYFLALLATIFAFQAYLVIRRVAEMADARE